MTCEGRDLTHHCREAMQDHATYHTRRVFQALCQRPEDPLEITFGRFVGATEPRISRSDELARVRAIETIYLERFGVDLNADLLDRLRRERAERQKYE